MLDGDLWTASLCHSVSPGCCSLIHMSRWAVPRPVRSMLWLFYNPDISMKLVLQSSWLSGLKSMELPRVFRYLAPTNPTRPGCLSSFLRFQYQLLLIKESFYPSQKVEHILLGLMTAGERMLHPLSKLEDSGKKSAVCQSSLGILRLIAVNRTETIRKTWLSNFFAKETALLPAWGLWYHTVIQAQYCLTGDHQHLKLEPTSLQNKAWLFSLSILSGLLLGPNLMILGEPMQDEPQPLPLLSLMLGLKQCIQPSTYKVSALGSVWGCTETLDGTGQRLCCAPKLTLFALTYLAAVGWALHVVTTRREK